MPVDAQRLAFLATEIQRLEALRPELERQRLECGKLEEMVKALRWEAYRAEEAYRQIEQEGSGMFGFISGLFGNQDARRSELLQVAVEAREAYDAAKEKFRPLKKEFDDLEAQVKSLTDLKAEHAGLVKQRAAELRNQSGSAAAALDLAEHELEQLASLKADVAELLKLGRKAELALLRCDEGNLFATRHEMSLFQKPFVKMLQSLHEFPAEWNLPPLPPEGDVRMLDPVGTGVDFRPPDLSDLNAMPLDMQGSLPMQQAKAAAMRAAMRATGEAVKNQAKFQAITVGHWLKRLEALQERLGALSEELERDQAAAVMGQRPLRSVSVAPAATAVPASAPPPRDVSANLQTIGRLALTTALTKVGDDPLRAVLLTVRAAGTRRVDLRIEMEDGSVQYGFPSAELEVAINDVVQSHDAARDGWTGFELLLLPTGQAQTRYLRD